MCPCLPEWPGLQDAAFPDSFRSLDQTIGLALFAIDQHHFNISRTTRNRIPFQVIRQKANVWGQGLAIDMHVGDRDRHAPRLQARDRLFTNQPRTCLLTLDRRPPANAGLMHAKVNDMRQRSVSPELVLSCLVSDVCFCMQLFTRSISLMHLCNARHQNSL